MFGGYEHRDDEGPEARAHREQLELDEWRQARVESLLRSLSPEDATRELFTFAEIKYWGLKTRRKRGG